MNAPEQINQLLGYLKLSPREFSNSIGYTRPDVVYILQSGKKPTISQKLAHKIVDVYPQISYNWLITGDGPMLNNAPATAPTINLFSNIGSNSSILSNNTITTAPQSGPTPQPGSSDISKALLSLLTTKDTTIDNILSQVENILAALSLKQHNNK